MEKTQFKLTQPIKAEGATIDVLELRRPTPLEVRGIKAFPYVVSEQNLPVVEAEMAARYMSVCCAIPPSSVNQLGLHDFNRLAWEIVGFFLQPALPTLTPSIDSPTT